ncbi:hypothetical protein D3C81_1912800 [compost metagenome]
MVSACAASSISTPMMYCVLATTVAALRAHQVELETWSSLLPLAGMLSTLPGMHSVRFSITSELSEHCTTG